MTSQQRSSQRVKRSYSGINKNKTTAVTVFSNLALQRTCVGTKILTLQNMKKKTGRKMTLTTKQQKQQNFFHSANKTSDQEVVLHPLDRPVCNSQ